MDILTILYIIIVINFAFLALSIGAWIFSARREVVATFGQDTVIKHLGKEYGRYIRSVSLGACLYGKDTGKALAHAHTRTGDICIFAERSSMDMEWTLAHEVAHLIAPPTYISHGPEWKGQMRAMGYAEEARRYAVKIGPLISPESRDWRFRHAAQWINFRWFIANMMWPLRVPGYISEVVSQTDPKPINTG